MPAFSCPYDCDHEFQTDDQYGACVYFKSAFDDTIYLRYYVKYPLSSKGYIYHESVWIGGYNPATSYPNPRASICGLADKRISIAYEPVNAPAMDTICIGVI